MVERSFKHGLSDFKSSSSLSVPIAQQLTTTAKGMASKALTIILSSSDLFWEKVKKKKKTQIHVKTHGLRGKEIQQAEGLQRGDQTQPMNERWVSFNYIMPLG